MALLETSLVQELRPHRFGCRPRNSERVSMWSIGFEVTLNPCVCPLRSYFCWWNLDFLLVFTSKIHVGRRWPVARGQKTWVFAEAAIEWCPQFHHGFCMNFNGNSRSLKWRYVSTIYGQFRFLKWPLLMMWPCQTASFNCVLSFSDTSKSLDIEIWQQQTTHRT